MLISNEFMYNNYMSFFFIKILLLALALVVWLSQCINKDGISLETNGISIKNFEFTQLLS
jgi:hypothetical protein